MLHRTKHALLLQVQKVVFKYMILYVTRIKFFCMCVCVYAYTSTCLHLHGRLDSFTSEITKSKKEQNYHELERVKEK